MLHLAINICKLTAQITLQNRPLVMVQAKPKLKTFDDYLADTDDTDVRYKGVKVGIELQLPSAP